MDYIIREMREDEYPLLKEFLYEAVYVAKGAEPPDRSITDSPELQVYIRDFGGSRHDSALVAEVNGDIIGAVWVRIMDDYGHIDDETPSLAISVLRPLRKSGIGTALLYAMLERRRMVTPVFLCQCKKRIMLWRCTGKPDFMLYLKMRMSISWQFSYR